ncbi:aryl-sulfate sulfotransferase [Tsukamurella soli]|uniref:Aryl-sulfate sulfotransferase n=1 Tax=Tsukamurella soli TaxID=644556 RepID=A0ABP8J0E1_9ACTN
MAYVRFTGVTYYDPERAYNSYVLYSGADSVTRLIDLNGIVRHEWPYPGLPSRIIDPAANDGRVGDVGLQLSQGPDPRGGIYGNRTVGQVSWTGEKLWEWGTEAPGGAARQNHDWELLPSGNRLLLVTVPRVVPGLGPDVIGDQGLYEVTPDGAVVWEWKAGDHLDELGLSEEGFDDLRATVARNPGDIWGYLEINSAKTIGPNRWHRADPDTVFQPDNILIGSRKANVVALIDKRSRSIVWRLGPYFPDSAGMQHQRVTRRRVPRPLDQISGQHNPHVIADGLPGAGDILLFDNQGGAGYPPAPLGIYAGSRVLEIDPTTREIVWQYTAEDSGLPPWTFFSSFVSNAQRLPNGNTLITEGMQGRIFQITPTGDVVWEYLTPFEAYAPDGASDADEAADPAVDRSIRTPLIYRSQAVPFDWVPADTPRSQEPVDRRG